MSMSIDTARKILEASKQRARELRSPVSIAIVDAGGHLVLFERMMSPYGWATGNISIAKASTAVMFNQSTDAVAQWGAGIPGFASSMATMTEGKFIMAAGGWPIRVAGATIGGIGVSGGNAPGRDDEIARAGIEAVDMPSMQSAQPQPMQPPPSIASQSLPPISSVRPVAPSSSSYSNVLPPYYQPASQQLQSDNTVAPQSGFPGQPNSTQNIVPDQDDSYNDGTFNQYNSDRSGGHA